MIKMFKDSLIFEKQKYVLPLPQFSQHNINCLAYTAPNNHAVELEVEQDRQKNDNRA